jgi:hypothetical protein
MGTNNDKGSALVIDPEKLGPEGFKLIGGIEALNAAEMTVRNIRERSTVVQERMFLAEIGDLLKVFADEHKKQLAALAMKQGAGELHSAPSGAVN